MKNSEIDYNWNLDEIWLYFQARKFKQVRTKNKKKKLISSWSLENYSPIRASDMFKFNFGKLCFIIFLV